MSDARLRVSRFLLSRGNQNDFATGIYFAKTKARDSYVRLSWGSTRSGLNIAAAE